MDLQDSFSVLCLLFLFSKPERLAVVTQKSQKATSKYSLVHREKVSFKCEANPLLICT